MDLQARKYQFIQELFKVEESTTMDKLEKLLETETKRDVVAYSVDGKPVSKEEYKKELREAEEEYQNGNYTSQEDLEKEVENW